MDENLSSQSLIELRAIAHDLGIRNVKVFRKAELIAAIEEARSSQPSVEPSGAQEQPVTKQPSPAPENYKKTPSESPAGRYTYNEPVSQNNRAESESGRFAPSETSTSSSNHTYSEPQSSQYTYREYNRSPQEDKPAPFAPYQNRDDDRYRTSRENSAPRNMNNRYTGGSQDSRPSGFQQRRSDNGPQNTRMASSIGNSIPRGRRDNAAPGDNMRRENPRSSVSSGNYVPGGGYQERRQPTGPVRNFQDDMATSVPVRGVLEMHPDGYGFLRCDNYLTSENDCYVSPTQIRKFGMRTGDVVEGMRRLRDPGDKTSALLYVTNINGFAPEEAIARPFFESMTPIFPEKRLRLERDKSPLALRVVDLLSPIGKGQRGMIVSPPKAGKTTLLKEIALSLQEGYPDLHLIILLIDERPEEVTDLQESIKGTNSEVIYSTFDETPEHHAAVAEMVLERAKRLVEHHADVCILLDSITRLTRAYNLVCNPSGRTLSGGLDPAALHMPKKFFGAARNMREGGSLTILATALVDTGSRMDDMVFEEFKGTGNMEVSLDRKLSERRIFPAIDIAKSGTRRDDLLLTDKEQDVVTFLHRRLSGARSEEMAEVILERFAQTKSNADFIDNIIRSMNSKNTANNTQTTPQSNNL